MLIPKFSLILAIVSFVAGPVNAEPNVPKGQLDSYDIGVYADMLALPQGTIFPKSPAESSDEFMMRVRIDDSATVIFPKSISETNRDFNLRLETAKKAKCPILPRMASESDTDFIFRMHAVPQR